MRVLLIELLKSSNNIISFRIFEHQLHEFIVLVKKHIDRMSLELLVGCDVLADLYFGLFVFQRVFFYWGYVAVEVLFLLLDFGLEIRLGNYG